MSSHEHRMRTSSVDANWRTPRLLFDALDKEARFTLDLAARAEDTLCTTWLGPGTSIAPGSPFQDCPAYENALEVSWMEAAHGATGPDVSWPVGFLNMPYSVKAWRETKDPAMLVENWIQKAWEEARNGFTTYAVCPFSPQTEWWRVYVEGHHPVNFGASEVRRLPHRIAFDKADGSGPADNTGNVNIAVVIFTPDPGYVGPWVTPHRYWTFDEKWKQRWQKHKVNLMQGAADPDGVMPDDFDIEP